MKYLALILALVVLAQCDEERFDIKKMGKKHGTMEMRHQLRKKLFREYDRVNIPDNVKCKVGLSIVNLELDTEKDILNTDVWMKLIWRDTRLSWDPKATNIDLLRVDSDEIWKPDITLYNSVKLENMKRCHKTKAIIFHTGHVLFMPPCNLNAHCNMTIRDHPREDQVCHLKFGSWVYDKTVMELEMHDDEKKGIDVDFLLNRKFEIKETRVNKNEMVYPGLPEKFPDITFDLVLKRNTNRMMMCNA